MNRVELLRAYKTTVEKMNVLADEERKKPRVDSGTNYTSVTMASLISDRARLSVALADNVAGVTFVGNR